jgi:hypothetical protein
MMATMPSATQDATGIVYSIVVPLFDCRDAGTRALASALSQAFERTRYEVIAVVDARSDRARWHSLLARCDRVVAADVDFDAVESEIALFDAGRRAARGEHLFFIEGHTVLAPLALRSIDEALARDPACGLACGRRSNHARTRLGMLIGGNNDVHEARAERHGNFTLGANCVIRRSLFEALGGFAPAFQRFNETVLYHRALDAGARIAAIDAILCTHHNDVGFSRLVRMLVATGRAKARYYASLRGAGRVLHTRHPVYRWLDSPVAAAIAALPLRVAGPVTIALAMALTRRAPRLAARLYRTGVGLTDVSGYCAERAAGHRRPVSTPSQRDAVAPGSLRPVAVPSAATAIDFERTA